MTSAKVTLRQAQGDKNLSAPKTEPTSRTGGPSRSCGWDYSLHDQSSLAYFANEEVISKNFMFPSYITISTTMSPDEVMSSLAKLTDTETRLIWFGYPKLKMPDDERPYVGVVDIESKRFRLVCNPYVLSGSFGRTIYNGRVEPDLAGSKVRIWIRSSLGGNFYLAFLFVITFIFFEANDRFSKEPDMFLVFVFSAGLIGFFIATLIARNKAKMELQKRLR